MAGNLIKTNKDICKKCKYHFGADGGGILCCDYLEMTGKRRNCPVGFCDKFEPIIGKRRRKKDIPWEKR